MLFHGDPVWNLYLPQFYLSAQEHAHLIDLFFDYFAFWCLRGQRESFHSAMRRALSPTTPTTPTFGTSVHYGPILHNAMLAIAMGFSTDPRFNPVAQWTFIKKAQEYSSAEMENPTLSGVLTFSYLATFFSGIGNRAAASAYFGVCASLAQICE